MILVRGALPCCAPSGVKPLCRKPLKLFDASQQKGPCAGLQDFQVKLPVGFFPRNRILGVIASKPKTLHLLQGRRRNVGNRFRQSQWLQGEPHFQNVVLICVRQRKRSDAALGNEGGEFHLHEALKGLSGRDVAALETRSDMILRKSSPLGDVTPDDFFCEDVGNGCGFYR